MNAAAPIQSVGDILNRPVQARALHVYTVPDKLAAETGVRTIGLVEITSREHMMAIKRVQDAIGQFAMATGASYELAKEALRMVNDVSVSSGDGSVDREWDRMGQKVRDLVVLAYGEIHTPEAADTAAFLKSHGIKQG